MSLTISNLANGPAFARDFLERSPQLNGPDLDKYLFPDHMRQTFFSTLTVTELLDYLARLRRIDDIGIVDCDDERFGVAVFSSANLKVIAQAADLAKRAHDGQQRRRSKADYFEEHIMRVVQIVVDLAVHYENACNVEKISAEERALALDTALIVGAFLHDTFEDSRAGVGQVERRFEREEGGEKGIHVAASLTKLSWKEYRDDDAAEKRLVKERAELFYNNTLSTAPIRDIFLKCCDRYANISSDWVTPDYTDNRYVLETAKPFQYFFSRLVAELPHGGVMLSFQESFEALMFRLVESSHYAAGDLPRLKELNQSPAHEQRFLSSDYSYDSVRYRAQDSVHKLIPEIHRFSKEVEQRDISQQNEWVKLLADSLEPVLARQLQSEAVKILEMDLLGTCRKALEELKQQPSLLRTLLPRALSELISCGDSQAVPQIDEWRESWLHAMSEVLAAIRDITQLEEALANKQPVVRSACSQQEEAGNPTDHTKLRLARRLRDIGARSSSSFPQLIDNLLEQGPPGFAEYLDAYARQLLHCCIANEAVSDSNRIQPQASFIHLLRVLESYQLDLRRLYAETPPHESSRQKQPEGSFIAWLLRSQEYITIGQDATFADLVCTLRDFVQTWRSSSRPPELKLSIVNPHIFKDLCGAQEAVADHFFFLTLSSLSKHLWGSSSVPHIKVVSDIYSPVVGGGQLSRRSCDITFHEMLSYDDDSDFTKSAGQLLSNSYIVEPLSSSRDKSQSNVLFFTGRVATSSLLSDRLVDLITNESIMLGGNGEVDLIRYDQRLYRITLVTAAQEQAVQLRRECLDPKFFIESPSSSTIEVYDFGSSLDHLATQGRGERYLWLGSSSQPLIELKILPQLLLNNNKQRDNEELQARLSSIQTSYHEKIHTEPWRAPLRELFDFLTRGVHPELSPNLYLQVVKPRPQRRPTSLVRHSVSINSPAS